MQPVGFAHITLAGDGRVLPPRARSHLERLRVLPQAGTPGWPGLARRQLRHRSEGRQHVFDLSGELCCGFAEHGEIPQQGVTALAVSRKSGPR